MGFNEIKHHKWEHQLLSEKSIAFLESLPYKKDITVEGIKISIMHYCMDRDGHYINYIANPSEDDLKEMFYNVESDIILYGHNHCRNICSSNKLYINAGSLGCPVQDRNLARAAILKIEKGNIEINPIDTEYDVNNVIDLIDKIDYPDSDNIKKYFYGIW